jgi:hypothetical protein
MAGSRVRGFATLAPRNRPDWADYTAKPVVRGGVEPPTFRFSELRIIVSDEASWYHASSAGSRGPR